MLKLPLGVAVDHPHIVYAASLLCHGGLVAFPTETVYGLGANGLDPKAVDRIFLAKGRPADNPLILHVCSLGMASGIVDGGMPPLALSLAGRFWPGPLTMVLPRAGCVPEVVSAGLPTIAVRVPSHPAALRLIEAAGLPIAAPSANTSGRPSPTTAEHVRDDLSGRVDLILDAGPTNVGLESTVVDLTGSRPRLLRPGAVTVEDLLDTLGELEFADRDERRPASPGMKYRHYAPAAPVTVLQGSPGAVRSMIERELLDARTSRHVAAALVHSELVPLLSDLGLVMDLGPYGRPDIVGQRLFALLRACDDAGAASILVEAEQEEGMGRAVMNRLLKASGGRIIHLEEGCLCRAD